MNEPVVRIAQILLFVCAGFVKKKSEGDSRANEQEIGLKVYLTTLVLTLLAGVWAAYWRGDQTDNEIRTKLLNQTIEIAGAVDPDQASKLNFTSEDAENPTYRIFRDYFTAYGRMIDQKSIYTMKVKDGAFFFGRKTSPRRVRRPRRRERCIRSRRRSAGGASMKPGRLSKGPWPMNMASTLREWRR